MEDQEIIDLYWSRSEQAITESSTKYGNYCYHIAYSILSSKEDSDECVNDTWMNAWNAMPPGRPNRLSVFLGKITRNLAINLFEKMHAEKRGSGEAAAALDELAECLPDDTNVENAVEGHLLSESLNQFLSGLPKDRRQILVLRYFHMIPVKEIAARTGCSESKVKMTLLRTRGELRKFLKKEGIAL